MSLYPHRDPNLPITEELPVVRPRSPGHGIGLALIGVLVAGGVIIGAAVLISQRDDGSSAEVVVPPTVTVPTVDPGSGSPEVVELDDEPSRPWQVTGAESGLNVRSGPGTNNGVITTLAPGAVVAGTGERVTVNGSEWKELDLGGDRGRGWASAGFLVPTDLEPGEVAQEETDRDVVDTDLGAVLSVGCFQGTEAGVTRTVRLQFRESSLITGRLRVDAADGVAFRTLRGELRNSEAQVVLTDESTGSEGQARWTFRPADVVLGNEGTVAIVDCATVASLFPPT